MKTAGVVAFAFGLPETIMPNQIIAFLAMQKAQELEAPVYTQAGIRIDPGIEVELTKEEVGKPSPTLRMARSAVEWAKRHALRELWISAAMPHLWRCKRDLERSVRAAGNEITVHSCKEIEEYPEYIWFTLNSTRPYTRSREAWEKRDAKLKLMPFCLYKLLAG